jgi:signal transduction histidine kinase
MTRLRGLLTERAGDALVLALLVASLLEAWWRAPDWRWAAIAPFALLWTLPLLLRRRSGLAVGLTVMAAAAASMLVTGGTVASAMWVAMLVAFAVIGLYEQDRARAVAGASVGGLLLLAVAVTDQGLHVGVVLTVAILAFAPFAGGLAVRARARRAAELAALAQRLERMRDEEERIAVAEERARIAAELNEVIARAVSGMTAQAGAARVMLRQDPVRARDAIEAVEETGREALAETRRLLGVLRGALARPEREPLPGLAALDVGTLGLPRVLDGVLPIGGAS